LVEFVFGDRWKSAVAVIAGMGVMAGFRQIGFNWQIFMRAVNKTRPIFFAALVNVGSFFAFVVPAVLALGLTGYAVGSALGVVAQLVARTHFLRGLFPRFSPWRQFARAAAPTVPAAAVVLLVRLVAGNETSLFAALGMLALFVLLTIAATLALERALVSEILGYLRGGGGIRSRAEAMPEAPVGA
jgi:O-antigen/teichoic acid export membrane protein